MTQRLGILARNAGLLALISAFGCFIVAAIAHADPLQDCAAFLPNGKAPVYQAAPAHHTELCHAPAFVLSHDDDAHEPRWVAWVVTADHLKMKNVGRTDDFRLDTDLPAGAGAKPSDYANAHEDKGHQSNAEDNGWSAETEHDSFLMSNMIPQCPPCNEQAFRYVENWTRKEALTRGVLYVIAGPVLGPMPQVIGKDKVAVPSASWKLVLDLEHKMAWGFIVPNEAKDLASGSDISPYLVSPQAVELAAGIVMPELGLDFTKSGPLN